MNRAPLTVTAPPETEVVPPVQAKLDQPLGKLDPLNASLIIAFKLNPPPSVSITIVLAIVPILKSALLVSKAQGPAGITKFIFSGAIGCIVLLSTASTEVTLK